MIQFAESYLLMIITTVIGFIDLTYRLCTEPFGNLLIYSDINQVNDAPRNNLRPTSHPLRTHPRHSWVLVLVQLGNG